MTPGQAIRLGLIVPSTNTTIEKVIGSGTLSERFGVEAVVTRIPVTTIARSEASDRQFDRSRMLEAARLVADARPHVVVWTGTSGLWLGLDDQSALLGEMASVTGRPATSSATALIAALRECRPSAVSVLTPYEEPVHAQVVAAHEKTGFPVAAHECLGIVDNAAFAEIPSATLVAAICRLSSFGLVSVACTNVLACVSGVNVVDSTVAMFWQAIRLADPARKLSYLSFYGSLNDAIGLQGSDAPQPQPTTQPVEPRGEGR